MTDVGVAAVRFENEEFEVEMTISVVMVEGTRRFASQGINESANFRFLQRQSVIFGFRRDCP